MSWLITSEVKKLPVFRRKGSRPRPPIHLSVHKST